MSSDKTFSFQVDKVVETLLKHLTNHDYKVSTSHPPSRGKERWLGRDMRSRGRWRERKDRERQRDRQRERERERERGGGGEGT